MRPIHVMLYCVQPLIRTAVQALLTQQEEITVLPESFHHCSHDVNEPSPHIVLIAGGGTDLPLC